jgi:alkylhydroperoxidase/carboxymuconolactone decarboxylase family protein YurZ
MDIPDLPDPAPSAPDAGETHERRVRFFGDLLGEDQTRGLRDHIVSDDFGKECGAWAADFAFGTVWTRPGLDRRMRSCAVLGMLMALRQADEIKYHVRIAQANGLTRQELEEVLYLSVPYAGFPAANTANTAKNAMLEALREIDDAAALAD